MEGTKVPEMSVTCEGLPPVRRPNSMLRLFTEQVAEELERARQKHPHRLASLHEGYAVILEEFDELWEEIKTQKVSYYAVLTELVQVAAMCQRLAEDMELAET